MLYQVGDIVLYNHKVGIVLKVLKVFKVSKLSPPHNIVITTLDNQRLVVPTSTIQSAHANYFSSVELQQTIKQTMSNS
jgi:hypothetical protein